jgi:hypothetical protein
VIATIILHSVRTDSKQPDLGTACWSVWQDLPSFFWRVCPGN